MNDEIEMKGGSGTKCKPQYSERMPRRNLQMFGWCLQFKQSYPQAFAILLFMQKQAEKSLQLA
jgi:hypothetical protein